MQVRDAWHPARMLDLSATGVRFADVALPSLGDRVRLQLRVPSHLLKVSGAVIRQGSDAAVELDPLTRYEQLALNAALLEAEPPTGPRHGAVLLMVHDPEHQLAIGRALRECGYEVIARTTPLDMVQRLAEPGARILAAIVAGNLPNRAGQDVLEFLATEQPWVRRGIVVDTHDSVMAPEANMHFVLVNPRRVDDVAPVVDDLRAAS